MKNICTLFTLILLCTTCSNEQENRITFIGDSLIANWDTKKYFGTFYTENLGHDGFTIEDCINLHINIKNETIIILVGTNNLDKGNNIEEIYEKYIQLIESIKYNRIICISILPRSDNYNYMISELNTRLKEYVNKTGYSYFLDVTNLFLYDEKLNPEYTIDGIHLNYKGYDILTKTLSSIL